MLRIDQRREGATIVVQAEGGVSGPWVAELRRVLAALDASPSEVALDLTAVGFVDSSGEELLREAVSRGIRIDGASGFVAALLDTRESAASATPAAASGPFRSDRELVDAVLEGREEAFLSLVDRCHGPMTRVVRCFVPDEAVAGVVRETWLLLLAELREWDGQRLAPRAACAAARRARAAAGEAAAARPTGLASQDGLEAATGPARPAPRPWPARPGREPIGAWRPDELDSDEALAALVEAIEALPPLPRAVLTLRDVAGCGAEETCAALELPEAEQRALLHRARSTVRAAIEAHFRAAA